MRQFLRAHAIKTMARFGVFPTRLTDPARLRHLLRTLHPLTSKQPLVRLGPDGDGGYLVPDDLEGILACFSPGVSVVSGFEKDCADRGMTVFLADKSVDQPAQPHERFSFLKRHVGATSNGDYTTLDDWVTACDLELGSELMLQIDIEGFEYEVFSSASDSLMRRFRIIVAEFHSLSQLWSEPFFDLANRAFEKILQTHKCVHIHPNNCCGSLKIGNVEIPRIMEFTFLRSDRIETPSHQTTFPNPLDRDNTSNATLRLPACWYGGN